MYLYSSIGKVFAINKVAWYSLVSSLHKRMQSVTDVGRGEKQQSEARRSKERREEVERRRLGNDTKHSQAKERSKAQQGAETERREAEKQRKTRQDTKHSEAKTTERHKAEPPPGI